MQKSKVRGTLLMSLLSLVISVAMLAGSTFAWFTDTASTGVNKIQAGKLEIDLEVLENGQWVSAEGKMISFRKAAGATGQAIIWEPGCTYELPELRVVNKGNLAIKYQISITGISGDEKLNEVIDWTINGQSINLEIETLAAGTNGPEFVLKGHMQENAGNEYQNLSIDGISISVAATQAASEYDSFSDQYDIAATFASGGSASEVLEYGREITSGIHTINTGIKATANGATALKVSGNGTEVTITDGEFDGGTNGTYSVWADNGAIVKITGGTFTVGGANAVIYASNNAMVLISGGFFNAESATLLKSNGGIIAVTGGTFVNFDPDEESFVRTDCQVVQESKENGDTWYKVQKTQTSNTELLRTGSVLNNYCDSIGCNGGTCGGNQRGHNIDELFCADGYTCLGTINKIAWVGDNNDFKLSIQKVSDEANADLKITKTDGTVDYIKIILEGQQSSLTASVIGADLLIMDDGFKEVEFLETGSWKCDRIYHYPGFSWDITNISAKS